ncbi:hypothetical protein PoB_000936000 [Plakobranchus ocellatus]|uniref:Uncharacterized protein n=1 Tax=Plakobranchus ocellatus TaxID=259542 RepID=A0AAV3YK32_9GAST|nr:hypothetical protein PoB_000936000 [Plakobranchus ocellatus]
MSTEPHTYWSRRWPGFVTNLWLFQWSPLPGRGYVPWDKSGYRIQYDKPSDNMTDPFRSSERSCLISPVHNHSDHATSFACAGPYRRDNIHKSQRRVGALGAGPYRTYNTHKSQRCVIALGAGPHSTDNTHKSQRRVGALGAGPYRRDNIHKSQRRVGALGAGPHRTANTHNHYFEPRNKSRGGGLEGSGKKKDMSD